MAWDITCLSSLPDSGPIRRCVSLKLVWGLGRRRG